MKSILTLAGVSAIALLTAIEQSSAQSTLVQWNFNSVPSDGSSSTGSTTPSTGSGAVTLVGGVTSTFATGSPGDPAATDNTGYNLTTWAAQGTGSGTRGLQVATSTVGFKNLTISMDFRQSGTVSRDFQLQVSSDGINFNNVSGGTASFGTVGSGNTGTSFSNSGLYVNNPGGGSQNFVQALTYNLALGGAYENDANFAFRWVAVFDPSAGNNYIGANAGTTAAYATSGTARFDMVTVTGDALVVPEPGTIALSGIGLAALAGLSRRRKS